jgi:hypothetical protein
MNHEREVIEPDGDVMVPAAIWSPYRDDPWDLTAACPRADRFGRLLERGPADLRDVPNQARNRRLPG